MSWVQRGLDIDGEAAFDLSGSSVSLSSNGNTVAIGAISNNGNGSDSGHVRVYDWIGSVWTQRGLDIDGEASNDSSGWAISLSSNGNTVAIGAPFNDVNGSDSGHVRVYDWVGGVWTQRGLDIDGEAAGDRSGQSVCLSSNGNTVAIGAPFNSVNGFGSGHVRVYDWVGGVWTQRGLDIDSEAGGDRFGFYVSLSNDANTIAIGAPTNGNGYVRVYDWIGGVWIQRGLDIDGEAGSDSSGWSVSLSSNGNTVAIGAPFNDGNGSSSGHVRIYDWNGSNWSQRGLDIDSEADGDLSGISVSLSSNGNIVAIGAANNDGINGSNSGHVRVYYWNGSNWVQRGSDIDGETSADQLGFFVSLSSIGNTVAIGARFGNGINGTDSGYARIYDWCPPIINNNFSTLANAYACYLGNLLANTPYADVLVVLNGFCDLIKQRIEIDRKLNKGNLTMNSCDLYDKSTYQQSLCKKVNYQTLLASLSMAKTILECNVSNNVDIDSVGVNILIQLFGPTGEWYNPNMSCFDDLTIYYNNKSCGTTGIVWQPTITDCIAEATTVVNG
ncbi:FG-GAp repeat protein [Fadolivirus algeromassiliense]|jgi:hypothetical protein|uniref:FG-GAp repeat protein n=1 Tax=Fadolivirus FV1/VV64 TaxID=3070911 RepID=A0A7D3QW55_9VIRU|nr:FG-GAp repeat protein [Fadolivirus algeromassiliense]QKF94864.1 FG-GAp repeat protein [Fadolivirus FV1/VV64]